MFENVFIMKKIYLSHRYYKYILLLGISPLSLREKVAWRRIYVGSPSFFFLFSCLPLCCVLLFKKNQANFDRQYEKIYRYSHDKHSIEINLELFIYFLLYTRYPISMFFSLNTRIEILWRKSSFDNINFSLFFLFHFLNLKTFFIFLRDS